MSSEVVVLALILINVGVFILPRIVKFGDGYMSSSDYFLTLLWKDNRAIRSGEYYRLITSTFVHSGLLHLFFNMYFLFNIGPNALYIFDPLYFLIIYFVSGFFGSLTSFLFSKAPSVGASGSLFGLLGSMLAVGIVGNNPPLIQSIMFTVALNFGIFYLLRRSIKIDNWGHLGGLISGFLVAFLLILVG